MPVGMSDGSFFDDEFTLLAESQASVASRMPLGSSEKLAGAFKPSGSTQTPDSGENLSAAFLQRLTGTPTPRPVTDILVDFAKEKAGHLIDALKTPGDAWAGKLDPMSPQGIERATSLAGLMVGGPAPVAGKLADGTLGSFAGVKAKTMDKTKLYEAQNMTLNGAHPDEVWQATGWFKGADDRWKFEISDEKAVLNESKFATAAETPIVSNNPRGWETVGSREHLILNPEDNLQLGDVLKHPELYKAYPGIENIFVKPMPEGVTALGQVGYDGSIYLGKIPKEEVRGILLHEVQHLIQNHEGFARGGSAKTFTDPTIVNAEKMVNEHFAELTQKAKDKNLSDKDFQAMYQAVRANEIGEVPGSIKERVDLLIKSAKYYGIYNDLVKTIQGDNLLLNHRAKAYENYARLMGEVEARNVQARLDFGLMDRFLKSPRSTEDRPRFVQKDNRSNP